MDSNDDKKKIEADLRKIVNKAFRQLMRSLEQEPSVILESEDQGNETEPLYDEIEAWLFERRPSNGDTNN
jgi:hypothetical protein